MAENNQEQQMLYARILARTWADEDFKARFILDAGRVLKDEYGLAVPKGLEIQVRSNTSDKVYLALDAAPSSETARADVNQLAASGCLGTIGTFGTAGCVCGTWGTAACIGTNGSW